MTRGRKKDTTIPPSRAVTQQREYRARRLQHVKDLEERLRKSEEENSNLRRELAILRSEQRLAQDSMALASSDLMRDLSVASASLHRFRQLAQKTLEEDPRMTPDESRQPTHRHASLSPSGLTSLYASSTISEPQQSHLVSPTTSAHPKPPASPMSQNNSNSAFQSRTPNSLANCCDGIMDCSELIDHVDREVIEDLRLLRSGRSEQVTLASSHPNPLTHTS